MQWPSNPNLISLFRPGTANAVFPTPYYSSNPNTTMSYRAPTPPAPSAVAAAAMAPTSFFLYHPQPAAPPAPPPIQFGVVRPPHVRSHIPQTTCSAQNGSGWQLFCFSPQQVPGIRSSPPPGPRPRMPYNRSLPERQRHVPLNMDSKTPSLHFSSPLSLYGLRFMPGKLEKYLFSQKKNILVP